MDRREFLQRGVAAAAVLGSAARATEIGDLPIIDTHQHLWDLKRFRLAWLESGSALDRDFLMPDYLEATKGLNVVKTVYMEVDVIPEQEVAEAEYVTEIGRGGGTPMVGAVISGRPASEGFAAYLDRFRDNRFIKGLRQVLHGPTPAGYCLEPEFLRGMRLLGERGLSFDLCMRPGELADAAKLVAECPDTAFILDHCGNANVRWEPPDRERWKVEIARIAERPNVSCKISGIVATLKGGPWSHETLAPYVDHCLDRFGPDRVVFGGDWPVCTLGATYAAWLGALKSIVADRPREQQLKLFHDNAVRVYRLS